MPTTKKTATKKTVEAAAKPAAKKAAPVKSAAASKATSTKKATAAKAETTPAKTASKAAVKTAEKKAVSTSKAPAAKPAATKKAAPVAANNSEVDKATAPAAKAPAAKSSTKKATSKENTSVAIKKPVKKKVAPLKEVKVPKTSVKTSKPYEPNYQPLEERKAADGSNDLMIRYSDAELEEFRVLINKKLADASREVAYLQGIITRKDDMGGDVDGRYMTMEDGTVSMEREQMSQMVSRQISFIDNLKKALIRIENKTYGVCRVTGKLIDKARLRAVPHATLSLEAKLGIVKPKEQN